MKVGCAERRGRRRRRRGGFMAGAHSVKIQGGAFSLRKSARKELFDTILI
jgi:hypothetical protein